MKTECRTPKPCGRWQLTGIILALVCAGAATLLLKRVFSDRRPPLGTPREGENQKAPPDSNGLLFPQPTTTQPEAQGDEDRVVALVTEGNELLAQGNYPAAVQQYQQAVAISPEEEDLHYNLAIALAKLGKTEDAKKHYEEALRIFPDYAEAHNNLGNLLMNEGKLEEATAHFREAIKGIPENASFHNNLGTAFARQGNVAEAMGRFEEAVKLSPTYVEARVNLANTFLANGRVEEAVVQLNEALRLRPDFKPALQALQRARQR
jgi:Tfp pilus assembly protein PilF